MNRRQIADSIQRVGNRYPEYIYELSHIRIYKEVPGMVAQAGGPIGVDEWWRLYWDPDVEVTGKDEELRMDTFILHELGHLNGNDAERCRELAEGTSIVVRMIGKSPKDEAGPVNQFGWNMTCDARINAELRKLAWTKTEGLVFPESLKSEWDDRGGHFPIKPPEWYYTELRESADPNGGSGGMPIPASAKQQKEGKGQPGPSGNGGGEQGNQPGQGGGGVSDKSDTQGQGEQKSPEGSGGDQQDEQHKSCGSIAHGQKHLWEGAPDEDCLTKEEQQDVIDATERRVAQKLVEGDRNKQSGSGIGTEALFPMLCDKERITEHYNHALWIDTIQQLLYRHLEQSKRTWKQPHRRIPGLPGRRRFPKQAVLVCDISGSINELSVVRTFEVLDRLFGRGFDIRIVACDTQAHTVLDRKARYSGGGTDMGQGVRFAAQKFPHASLIIVVTDGGTPWPEENPASCPVVVLSWKREGPDWAMNIPMPGLTKDYPVKPPWERTFPTGQKHHASAL